MTLADTTMHTFPLGLPERIAAQLEETETATQNGFTLCVSAVIVALRQHVSGEHEAQALLVTLREGNYPHLDPADLEGEQHAGRLAVACRGVLGRLFGDRLEGTTDAIARESGLTTDSVRSLLGLSTPLVLSALKDHVFSEQYDAEHLSGYLQRQSRIAADKLPDAVLLATGWATATRVESAQSSGVDSRRSVPPPPGRTLAPQPSASGSRRTLAVAMAALALLGVLGMALFAVLGAARRAASERSMEPAAEVDRAVAPKPLPPRPAENATPSPAETPEPVEPEPGPSLPEMAHPEAPAEIEVLSAETGAGPLARYATSGESLPRVFVLRDVELPSGVEGLAPNPLLDSVARVLREQPRLRVRLEGHTPPSKGPRAARRLSEQWAEAVKAYLVERGVEAERVEALGLGSAEPIDTNEMPEGRARNRRIQLVVIGR